jgi:hypothetical protein
MSANLCLLPDFAAHFNKLSSGRQRAHRIGEILANQHVSESEDVMLSTLPRLDILCLQEVFAHEARRTLAHALHGHYRWLITHARGPTPYYVRLFCSGLFFASSFPVLDSRFVPYSTAANEDILASKGVLLVKV